MNRYGTPAIPGHSSWRLDVDAKEMKKKLMTGADPILTPPAKARKEVFPPLVKQMAIDHWVSTTIPEPSVNRRMKRKERRLEEGEQAAESVPTRWQHLTAEEQYSSFKDECAVNVRVQMQKKAEADGVKVSLWPESEDKTRRLERLEKLPGQFPGRKWYFEQKPEEVKPLVDHTTGLCRICEAASLNYNTFTKAIQRLCACRTRLCPNWTCLCAVDEVEEDQQECQCGCSCDDCLACQVQATRFHKKRWHVLLFQNCR